MATALAAAGVDWQQVADDEVVGNGVMWQNRGGGLNIVEERVSGGGWGEGNRT